jgi:hypothetical protein
MNSTAGLERLVPSSQSRSYRSSWSALSRSSQFLVVYAALMVLALAVTYLVSLGDTQTLRGVGIWAKPMKFMVATALFAATTVWLVSLVDQRRDQATGQPIGGQPIDQPIDQTRAFKGVTWLIVVTSLFEVAYITFRASQGEASHYNTSDPVRAILFGVMAVAAVGLTASQAWLAWIIWRMRPAGRVSVITLSVLIALVMTFALSTASGFMLGASQPPAGAGMPITGWHWYQDLRPSHFLAVHAQQLIPLLGLGAVYAFGQYARTAVVMGSVLYFVAWVFLAWVGWVNLTG